MPAAPRAPPRPVASLRVRQEVEGLVDRVEELVGRTIHEAHPSPALLHDLHRDMRRLAISLGIFARFLPPVDATRTRPVVKRLRRLARLVGRVRDRDVTAALLVSELPRAAPAGERRRLERFLARMRDDARTARELLKAYLHTARGAGALGQARDALARPLRRGASAEVPRGWEREAAAFERKLRKALRRAQKTPTPDRLHRLRIRIRQHRQLTSLAGALGSPGHRARSDGMKGLQDRLGRIHDLDVALATLPPGLEASAVARRLRARRRGERARVRGHLARPALPVRAVDKPSGPPGGTPHA